MCFEIYPCLDGDIWIGCDLHVNGGPGGMHTGSRRVRPGVLLVTPHVHCCCCSSSTFNIAVFPDSAPHREQRICLIWVGILESGEHLPTKTENYRSLSSMVSKWKQRKMSFIEAHFRCFFPMNVEHSRDCRDLRSHWPIRYRSAGQRALFSFRAFSWKTVIAFANSPEGVAWRRGNVLGRAHHLFLLNQNRTQLEIQF